jgi:tetratricopeptide (TPR) repeat protein
VSAAEVSQIIERNARARLVAARAAGADPTNPAVQAAAAQAFAHAGAYEQSVAHWKRASMLAPANGAMAVGLGKALEMTGDFAGAKAAFRRAIALEPNNAEAYYALTHIERQTPLNNHLDALKRVFSLPSSDGVSSLQAGHALARTCEDFGQLEDSFEWLRKAKAIRGRLNPYAAARERAAAEAAMAAASGEASGFLSEEPIFVVGMPRTGTSLVDRILSMHPCVTSAGELSNFTQLLKAMVDTGDSLPLDAASLAAIASADLGALGRAYVDSTRPITGQTPRFVDKTPINYLLAGIILRALPNARIVCLVRDPMDACLSLYRQMFLTDKPYYNFNYDLANTAAAYALHNRVLAHWRKVLPSERYLEVRYEDVVADLENQARRMVAFCGLDWDLRCLSFHENPTAIATPSASQVRQPLYASSVGRWRKYGALLDAAKKVLVEEGLEIPA